MNDVARSRSRTFEIWLGVAVFAATAFVFWPLSRWLVSQTLIREQLHYALVVLAVAGLIVARRNWGRHSLHLTWSGAALGALAGSYACVVAASFLKLGLLMLPGSMLALAAAGIFLLGPGSGKLVGTVALVCGAFISLVILFPLLDWPLREFSGVFAAKALKAIGLTPTLALASIDPPRLILAVNGRLFEVATECNGFGTISAAALLALILAISASGRFVARILFVPVAVLVGAAFNVLRILGICLLVPVFPDHYAILHETIGVIALWSALGIVWWLSAPGAAPSEKK